MAENFKLYLKSSIIPVTLTRQPITCLEQFKNEELHQMTTKFSKKQLIAPLFLHIVNMKNMK